MTASVRAGLFDRQRLLALPDWLAIGVALSLPWSTSLTGIVIALWLLAVLPTLDRDMLWAGARQSGRRAAGPAVGFRRLRHAVGRRHLERALRRP